MTQVPREGDTKFKVLVAIQDHWGDARFGPTVEELRETVGVLSRSTVQFHINDLLSDGYLSHAEGKRRTLRVTRKGDMLLEILGV
jgi:SOS-response transcriptional repressor LexA